MSLELQASGADFVLFERGPRAGSFFERLPKFGRLISINKRYVPGGAAKPTFAMRHDWNSLLAPGGAEPWDPTSKDRFTSWSEDYYPSARLLAKYLSRVARTHLPSSRVHYSHTVTRVSSAAKRKMNPPPVTAAEGASTTAAEAPNDDDDDDARFELRVKGPTTTWLSDQLSPTTIITALLRALLPSWGGSRGGGAGRWRCGRLIWATNFETPNEKVDGISNSELAVPYDKMVDDPMKYKNKTVLVIGGGNSAFEIAKFLAPVTAHVHILARSVPSLAWQTHYPGDVRAVNAHLLDHYQLKSLDAIIAAKGNQLRLTCGDPFAPPPRGNFSEARLAALRRQWGGVLEEFSADGKSRQAKAIREAIEKEGRADVLVSESGGFPGAPCGKLGYSLTRECDRFDTACNTDALAEWELKNRAYEPYDLAVLAIGWRFAPEKLFDLDVRPAMAAPPAGKFPALTRSGWASANVEGLYFAGTIAHAHDWRRASGGFIHGFRYTARALVRSIGEDTKKLSSRSKTDDSSSSGWPTGWPERASRSAVTIGIRNSHVRTTTTTAAAAAAAAAADKIAETSTSVSSPLHALMTNEAKDEMLEHIVATCGLGDGIYQMFSELTGVIVLNDTTGNTTMRVYDEVPVRRLMSGLSVGGTVPTTFVTVTFEYGANFHGQRVLEAQGATGEFISPVLRFYDYSVSTTTTTTSGETRCRTHSQCAVTHDKSSVCGHQATVGGPVGRCDRESRTCVCGEAPTTLSGTSNAHYVPPVVKRGAMPGENLMKNVTKPKRHTSIHPLDEFSETMPDIELKLAEELATTWDSFTARVQIECFLEMVAAAMSGKDLTETEFFGPQKHGCEGVRLEESRAFLKLR